MPHLEQLQAELGSKVKTFKLNAFDNRDLSAQYRVMAVPTVIVFHKGEAAARWTGITTADTLKAKIAELPN